MKPARIGDRLLSLQISSVLVLEWLWIGELVDISFMEKTAVLPSGDQVHQVDNVSWWIGR